MSLFEKKETVTLYSEQQKDDYIEKLDQAHIVYDLRVKKTIRLITEQRMCSG